MSTDSTTDDRSTFTVDIPGGQATLRTAKYLTERQRRPLKVRVARLGEKRLQQMMAAESTTHEGLAAEIEWTEREAEILVSFTDCLVWALLASWTLDRPLPETPDDVQDWPGDLYDALALATAKEGARIVAGDDAEPFTVQAVTDPASPTGASGA